MIGDDDARTSHDHSCSRRKPIKPDGVESRDAAEGAEKSCETLALFLMAGKKSGCALGQLGGQSNRNAIQHRVQGLTKSCSLAAGNWTNNRPPQSCRICADVFAVKQLGKNVMNATRSWNASVVLSKLIHIRSNLRRACLVDFCKALVTWSTRPCPNAWGPHAP